MKPIAAAVISENSRTSCVRTEPNNPRASAVAVAEPVADPPHREQILGPARIALELLAQVADVDVDRPRIAELRVAPDPPEQRLAGEHAARRRRPRGQDLELDVRELHGRAAHV